VRCYRPVLRTFILEIFQYTPNLRHLTFAADFPSDLLEILFPLPASKYWESITFSYLLNMFLGAHSTTVRF
jgi:hypothetical protein